MTATPVARPVPFLGRRRSTRGLWLSSTPREAQSPTRVRSSSPLAISRTLIPPGWFTMFSLSSSSEDSILPLSASSKTSFDENELELSPSPKRWSLPLNPELLFVVSMFPLSAVVVLFSVYTLPISLSWPKNLSDLAVLGSDLQAYAESGFWPTLHVATVLSLTASWKHAWSVPGSVIWNVLAGALWSPVYATVLMTLLTSLGSVVSTMLAKPLAPILLSFMPRAIHLTRQALQGSDDASPAPVDDSVLDQDPPSARREKFRLRVNRPPNADGSGPWVRLSILRLIGIIPWAALNIACGISGVPLFDCIVGAFIGCLPWTAVTCQIGDILQTVAHAPGETSSGSTVSSVLTSREVILKLALLSFLSLSPILGRNYLKAFVASHTKSEEKKAGWHPLRIVPPVSRHSRHPTQELNQLVLEKMADTSSHPSALPIR